MERRQTAQTYDSGVKERNIKYYPSNPRGFDASVLTKKTGAVDSCVWNGYYKGEIAPRPCATVR